MRKLVFDVFLVVVAILMACCVFARGDVVEGAVPLPKDNGCVRQWLTDQAERWEVNGKDVDAKHGRSALHADGDLVDDSKLPSLTLIGSKGDTSKLREGWKQSAELAGLVERFIVQEFAPSNPLIARAGFLTKASPTIYAEMPDGRVLFRLDGYPGDQDFVRTVQAALQAVDGVRKPQDGYTPASDPGVMLPIKPKIDAEVSPSPAVLIMSHAAAFGLGVVAALTVGLGGWLAVKKLLAAAIAAEMARVTPASSPSSGSSATPAK